MPERKLFDIARRWIRLFLSLRPRSSGRFYISFARLGLLLSIAGLAPWFPSVKQQLLDWLAKRAIEEVGRRVENGASAEPNLIAWQLGISLTCFLSGIAIIVISLMLFDRSIRGRRLGEENNDAINIRVLNGTTLKALVTATAGEFDAVVNLDEMPQEISALIVSTGPLRASSFSEFLNQVSARTTPPKQVTWSEEGEQFFVAKVKTSPNLVDAGKLPAN